MASKAENGNEMVDKKEETPSVVSPPAPAAEPASKAKVPAKPAPESQAKDETKTVSSMSSKNPAESTETAVVTVAAPEAAAPVAPAAASTVSSSGRSSDASWMRMYQNLKSYQAKHNGSLDVSIEEGGVTNQALSRWVVRQRKQYQKDPLNGIPPDRKKLLDDLGFVWVPKPKTTRSRSRAKSKDKQPPARAADEASQSAFGPSEEMTKDGKDGNKDKEVKDIISEAVSAITSKPSPDEKKDSAKHAKLSPSAGKKIQAFDKHQPGKASPVEKEDKKKDKSKKKSRKKSDNDSDKKRKKEGEKTSKSKKKQENDEENKKGTKEAENVAKAAKSKKKKTKSEPQNSPPPLPDPEPSSSIQNEVQAPPKDASPPPLQQSKKPELPAASSRPIKEEELVESNASSCVSPSAKADDNGGSDRHNIEGGVEKPVNGAKSATSQPTEPKSKAPPDQKPTPTPTSTAISEAASISTMEKDIKKKDDRFESSVKPSEAAASKASPSHPPARVGSIPTATPSETVAMPEKKPSAEPKAASTTATAKPSGSPSTAASFRATATAAREESKEDNPESKEPKENETPDTKPETETQKMKAEGSDSKQEASENAKKKTEEPAKGSGANPKNDDSKAVANLKNDNGTVVDNHKNDNSAAVAKRKNDKGDEKDNSASEDVESMVSSDLNTSSDSEDESSVRTKQSSTTKRYVLEDKQRRWLKCFRMLKRHQKKNQTLDVRETEHKLLFHWIWKQRMKHKHGGLSRDRTELLESIGFHFHPPMVGSASSDLGDRTKKRKKAGNLKRGRNGEKKVGRNKSTNINLKPPPAEQEAKLEEKKEGDANANANATNGNPEVKLNCFVPNTDPDILALNEHLPIKSYTATKNKQWFEKFEVCKEYKRLFGTTFVSRDKMPKYDGLYNWTYRQRRLLWEYQLSRDRKELLDEMGFDWGAPAVASATTVMQQTSAENQHIQEELKEGNYGRKRKRYPAVEEAKAQLKEEANDKGKEGDNSSDDESSSSDDSSSSSSDEDEGEGKAEAEAEADSGLPNTPYKGPKKEAPAYQKMWLNKCAELKAYKRKYGTTNIHHKNIKKRGLYHWARRQRMAYKRKELSEDRIRRLEALDFQWELPTNRSERDAPDPTEGHISDGDDSSSTDGSSSTSAETTTISQAQPPAVESSKSQPRKRSYRNSSSVASSKGNSNKRPRKRGPFSAESSDDDGSATSITSEGLDGFQKRWLNCFRELKAFRRAHGTMEVRYKDKEHRFLYHWIRRQRERFRDNDMPEDRKAVLDEIGFEWEVGPPNEAKENHDDESNSSLSDDKEEPNIDDSSDEEENEEEESLPLESKKTAAKPRRRERDQEKWMDAYNALRSYYKKYKTFDVSYSHTDKRFLYYWVWRQRKLARQGELPSDRKELLKKIDFDFGGGAVKDEDKSGSKRKKTGAQSLSASSQATTTNASSVASASTSMYASTDQIPVPVGKVEDMENYLDSVEKQIKEKEEELKSLRSVASRVRFLLQKAKPAIDGS